jgi:hypothetical protein
MAKCQGGDHVGPSSNHSNHVILMECHNITMVVYQTIFNKWSMDFANDNDCQILWPYNQNHHLSCST